MLIDIGNSRVKGRVIGTAASPCRDLEPVPLDRLDQLADRWTDDSGVLGGAVDLALISNVAGDAGSAVGRWLGDLSPVTRIEHVVAAPVEAGVINGYIDPTRLGPDRWMALIGAHALLPDRSLLVCTFGTATTLDLLVHEREGAATFVGGLIVPGFDAMRAALVGRRVHRDVAGGAIVDFADNTADAIASGVRAAQLGAVRDAWRRARDRTTGPLDLIVAGGAGSSVLSDLQKDGVDPHLVPDLVLRGLAIVAEHRMGGHARSRRPAHRRVDGALRDN